METIELFGLSNTGKSAFKKRLIQTKQNTLSSDDLSLLKKLLLFGKYTLKKPLNTTKLFYKLNTNWAKTKLRLPEALSIWRMRNSYLLSVLAKWEHLQNNKETIWVDEGPLQSIFMIYHTPTTTTNLKKLLQQLPTSSNILVFHSTKKKRHTQYAKKHPYRNGTLLPGSGINKNYAKKWMQAMEKNFDTIEKLLPKEKRAKNKLNIQKVISKHFKKPHPKIMRR